MTNPDAPYRTAPGRVRAARILALTGLLALVPAAGTIAAAVPAAAVQNPAIFLLLAADWEDSFRDSFDRVRKSMTCPLVNAPGSPEDLMRELQDCWRHGGLSPEITEPERRRVYDDIDDLLHETEKAPETISSEALASFRGTLFDMQDKLR
jgi:hypothetical protein